MIDKSTITEFWVTNLARRAITIEDFNITIPSHSSINLLHKRNGLTVAQLVKSQESGSIFKKSQYLKVRYNEPKTIVKPGSHTAVIPRTSTTHRSQIAVPFMKLEEMLEEDLLDQNASDTQFAMEMLEDE